MPITTNREITQMIIEAIAIPLPVFLPLTIPTNPMMPKIRPRVPKSPERKLINGRNEVSSAIIPSTNAATAMPDLEGGIGGIPPLGAPGF